jgi:TrmH family RNA methyltransferase
VITSLQNPLVKKWRRLNQKRHRDREGLFLIEGEKELAAAVASGISLQTLIVCPDLLDNNEPPNIADRTETVSKEIFTKLAYRESVGGLLGIATYPDRNLTSLKLSTTPLVLILVGFEKPGNVGAILRTADGANVDVIFLANSAVDLYNPNIIRASLGAIFTVPIFSITTDQTLTWLKQKNLKTIAATPQAKQVYTEANYNQATALIIGSEHQGLPQQWLNAAETKIKIPMQGQMDSLNASCSAAILTYEALRQRSS